MFLRLWGLLQLHRFLFGHRWAYVASGVGVLIGVVMAVSAPPATMPGSAVAVAAIGLGTATFIRDSKHLAATGRELHQVKLGTAPILGLHRSDRYRGYRFVDLDGERCLVSEDVNHLLRARDLELKPLPERFELGPPESEYAPFILREAFWSGAVLFNSRKVRLTSDLTYERLVAAEPVRVQETDYFASLCTNEVACHEIRSRASQGPLLSGPELISNNGILDDLEVSRCSNHIGISTLALTSDGALVITTQARGSAQSPGQLTSSGSGSADWSDVHPEGDTLQAFLIRAMNRELAEECGLRRPRSATISTRLLGFARVLGRGGKPEFFGLSHLDAPFSALRITRKEQAFIANIDPTRVDRSGAEELRAAIVRFRSEKEHTFSPSLRLNVRFLEDYLSTDPASLFTR